MIIYADTDVCEWHLRQLNITPTRDLADLSIKSALFHIPFLYDQSFEKKIDQALLQYDKIAIIGSELHGNTVDFIIRYQQEKIKFFLCGFIDTVNSTPWMDWFIMTADHYKNNNILKNLTPYCVKIKAFDILLGKPKYHRTHVYDYINNNNLNDNVIMTYLLDRNLSIQQQDTMGWLWEDGIETPTEDLYFTVTPIKYCGEEMTLSQVVPTSIYNQTAYTVVCETNWDNHYSFYTEKIVKPILAERLFVVFSGQHYLRNLRSLGFKTFDGIIDESYDDVDNHSERFDLICQQIKYLIDQPQQEILDKIKPITEHNKQLMLENDWYGNFSKELRAVLLDHTN